MLTSLSTGHFLLRSVLRWLRHFTAKLHYTKNACYKGVIPQLIGRKSEAQNLSNSICLIQH